MNDGLVSGIGGVNATVAGPMPVGVEGNAAHGFTGDIDWQYDVKGRLGLHAGERAAIPHRRL